MTKRRRFGDTTEYAYVVGEGKLLPSRRRGTSRYTGPKPIRTSPALESRFSSSTCWVCKSKIAKGTLICRAKFGNGKERWVHTLCAADPHPDGEG